MFFNPRVIRIALFFIIAFTSLLMARACVQTAHAVTPQRESECYAANGIPVRTDTNVICLDKSSVLWVRRP